MVSSQNRDSSFYETTFVKWYGAINGDEALGLSDRTADWSEIACQIDEHCKRHGPLLSWIDWSSTLLDYEGLFVGLKSGGKAHLIPKKPSRTIRPLMWWRGVRQMYGLGRMSLTLGNLFEILYPKERELLSRAHFADADVQMLRKIVDFLFRTLPRSPVRGTMEAHLPNPEEQERLQAGVEAICGSVEQSRVQGLNYKYMHDFVDAVLGKSFCLDEPP